MSQQVGVEEVEVKKEKSLIGVYWLVFCPNCFPKSIGPSRMAENRDKLWECPKCHICISSSGNGHEILIERGTGDFRYIDGRRVLAEENPNPDDISPRYPGGKIISDGRK